MKKPFLAFILFLSSVVAGSAQEDDLELYFSIGGTYHAPRTDYVSQFGGMNLGITAITYRQNVYMIDFVAGIGEARKKFHTSEGWIYNGDDLTLGQLYFNYGHVVHQKGRSKFYPYVGMGFMCYDYTYMEGDEEHDDIIFTKGAFSTKIGACYDICLSNPSADFTHSIRFQPYAAVSFYNAPLHVVPSFNLSISYCIGF